MMGTTVVMAMVMVPMDIDMAVLTMVDKAVVNLVPTMPTVVEAMATPVTTMVVTVVVSMVIMLKMLPYTTRHNMTYVVI